MTQASETILAVDPGRSKVGLAVVRYDGVIFERKVCLMSELSEHCLERWLNRYGIRCVVLGNGTAGSFIEKILQKYVQADIIKLVEVDEAYSTEAAKKRYWKESPPCGWRAWVPTGLLSPPQSIDDWAAVILAERYFKKKLSSAGVLKTTSNYNTRSNKLLK